MTTGQRLACDVDEMRMLFLFETFNDTQLEWLCLHGHVELFEPGWVYRQGDPATYFYVLLDGGVSLSSRVGDRDVETNRTTQVGVYAGAWSAFLADPGLERYNNSMRVTVASRMYVLPATLFSQFMHQWFPMPLHLLEGLFYGMHSTQQAVGQRERLLALGSLSAGLTHELNNPATAALRAASTLREGVTGMRDQLLATITCEADRRLLHALIDLRQDAAVTASQTPQPSPLETADREDALSVWLDEHGIDGGWDLASAFVQARLDVDWLERVNDAVDDVHLEGALRWLQNTIDTEAMIAEIEDATKRVSALIAAAGQYSQLDRAPYRTVDVHELLDSTLAMLKAKIGGDITVVRHYDTLLPKVPMHAAELNQVWTNLIDNAVDAMSGRGTLTVRTAREDDWLLVQICDTGPGVPPGLRERIFEPFFTTKPVGSGTGLGLDISWRIVNRHRGDLSVRSAPGDTRFCVRLPLSAAAEDSR